jgi:peptidoglycan/xylan/chitin deacetylase (PgdA/CDA1 family)
MSAMNSPRVLLLSNTRPSRSWRFAHRVERELPGAKICGIVQRHVSKLALEQRQLAAANASCRDDGAGLFAHLRAVFERCADFLLHGVLWFVHGCPPKLNVRAAFGQQRLAENCIDAKWPFLAVADLDSAEARQFVARHAPDLVIVLGEPLAVQQTDRASKHDILSARMRGVVTGAADATYGVHIQVEYSNVEKRVEQSVASVTLPRQVYDSPIGVALKADLIADDLLIHAGGGLCAGEVTEAKARTSNYIADVLMPYLTQTGPSRPATRPTSRRWYRSAWSLTAETVLLCSPLIVARNWVRRMRGCYPVLILVHHLVSDRAHRMSISTESFWRQVLFLRRHYQFASLSESAKILRSGCAEAPTVCLTFDDGYSDNFVSLRAVAEEIGLSPGLFVTTEPVDLHREFQHDVIKGYRGAFPLTWSQIRYWKDRGAEFGTHTRRHIKCGAANRTTLEEEIVGSNTDFEARLGERPQFFAFPYGSRQDCPPEAIEVAASSCSYYLSAFGGENTPNERRLTQHLFRKNAYPEPWELELEVQSVFDFVESVKRLLRASRNTQKGPIFVQTSAAAGPPGLQPALNFDKSSDQLLSDSSSSGIQRFKPS